MINETLSSIAEIAITLAGFAGLLTAFRSSRTSIGEELRRIVYIFAFCFSVVIGAFLPVIVETFSPGSELNWQLPIFLIALVAVFISINSFRQSLTGHITMQIPVISYSMMSVLLVVGLIELGVLVGISPGAPHGYLIIGLLWFVAHAGYLFVSTLFWAQANKDDI